MSILDKARELADDLRNDLYKSLRALPEHQKDALIAELERVLDELKK